MSYNGKMSPFSVHFTALFIEKNKNAFQFHLTDETTALLRYPGSTLLLSMESPTSDASTKWIACREFAFALLLNVLLKGARVGGMSYKLPTRTEFVVSREGLMRDILPKVPLLHAHTKRKRWKSSSKWFCRDFVVMRMKTVLYFQTCSRVEETGSL